MYTLSVEQCVMGYAVRYERMGQIIQELFSNNKYSTATEINLFIPLTEIFHNMRDIDTGKNSASITAAILNLCAHYKNFFKRGYGVECNIFMIHSSEEYPLNKCYIPEYSHKQTKIIDTDIDNACELLNMICPYLNKVQYLTTKHECALLMINIVNYLMSSSKNIPSLVLSKDIYNTQLVCSNISTEADFIIIRPTKYMGEDNSYYINRDNLYETFCKTRKVAVTDSIKKLDTSVETYSLLLAMTRLPERNIKSLYDIPKAVKTLNDIGTMVAVANDNFLLDCRLNAISIIIQYTAYMYQEMIQYAGYPRLYDPQSINSISNSYFKKYPVDFLSLI